MSRRPRTRNRTRLAPPPAVAHEEDRLVGEEKELVHRDTLPRLRVKPMGRAVDALRALDACLDDLYRPEAALEQFYKPAQDYAYLNYAITHTKEGRPLDPIGHHRIQIPYQAWNSKAARWELRCKQHIVRSADHLKALSETPEWRRARFAEATGDWVRVVPMADYRRLVEGDPHAHYEHAIRAQLRQLRESMAEYAERMRRLREASGLTEAVPDTFGTDTTSSLAPDPMRSIDRDVYIPIAGGQMNRQLYLYAHWEQTAKAFEMKNHSELAKAAINIKSDFTLGRGMAWKVNNPRVASVWQEFWDRNKMETRIRQWSDDLTWQGELLIRKYEMPRGFLCVRSMDPGAFQEIVTDPQDIETVFFYAQSSPTPYQMVHWDYRGQKLNLPTMRYVIQQYPPAEMFHLKSNVSSGEKWGRSDFYTAFTTLKRHRDWTNAATLKDMLAANLVWKIKVSGDQGDVDAFVQDQLNATLPPMGGTWVENEATNLEPLHAEFGGSGRMGQGSTGNFLTALFATSQNMPVSYFNIAPGGTARATALTQGEPFIKAIGTRQQQLRMVLDHLFEQVMECAVRAGRVVADALRGEDADPEWIFPSPFEEDRGAKFRDLRAARELAVISHETMAVQMAQELGQDEYSYTEEQEQILRERTSPVLMLWPEKTEQEALLNPSTIGGGMAGPGGMPGAPGGPPGALGGAPPPNPFGSDQDKGAPPTKGGGDEENKTREPEPEPKARSEELKGADERASFRRQWAGRGSGGSPPVKRESQRVLDLRDRRYLETALPGLRRGMAVTLPSGRIARIGEADQIAGNLCRNEAGSDAGGEFVACGEETPGTPTADAGAAAGGGAGAPQAERPKPDAASRARDRRTFEGLKRRWAEVNNELLRHVDNPSHPQARAKMAELKDLVKEMYRLEADPGGLEGIGLPGGPRDLLIIGAGPGGLSAAVMGGTDGLDTLVLDAQSTAGGQAKHSSRIENYPGFPIGLPGKQLAERLYDQAGRVGAETRLGVRAVGLTYDPATGLKTVLLSNGETIEARAVIIAGGLQFRRIEFPGSDSERVIYGDGEALAQVAAGKPAIVIGGSNGAAQAALGVAQTATMVYLLSRSAITKGMSDYQVQAVRNHPRIQVIEGDEVKEFRAKEGLLVTTHGRSLPATAVGVFVGSAPDLKWLPPDLRLEEGKVGVNADLETSVPGVFAIGDIRHGSIGRIGTAVGDGQIGERNVIQYFEREKKRQSEKPKP